MNKFFLIIYFLILFFVNVHCINKNKKSITRVDVYCLNIRANTPNNITCDNFFYAFEQKNILNFSLNKQNDINKFSESIKLSKEVDKLELDVRAIVRIYYSTSKIDTLCLPSESQKGNYLYNGKSMRFKDNMLLNFIDSLQRSK